MPVTTTSVIEDLANITTVCGRRCRVSLIGGRPDFVPVQTSTEQVAIENACDYYKRNRGPGEYYGCLRKELSSLAGSGGRPDISRVSRLEQTSIEKACDYYKRNRGPGEYYSCLRKELASLGFR